MKPTVDRDTAHIQQQINAVKTRLAELDSAYAYAPTAHRGEPVSYTDTWSNVDTDLRDAGQRDLADRIKRMRDQGDA